MPRNRARRTSSHDDDKDGRMSCSPSRQLPALGDAAKGKKSIRPSGQKDAPETTENSVQIPIRTARLLAAPETSSNPSNASLMGARQLAVPEVSIERQSIKTSRQLITPEASSSDPPSRNRRSSRNKSSRVEFVEHKTTIHEYTREDICRETRKKKHSHQDSTRKDASRNHSPHKKSVREEPPREVDLPKKKTLLEDVDGIDSKSRSKPVLDTDSRISTVASSGKKSKDKFQSKNTTRTSITTKTEITTKSHSSSSNPNDTKAQHIQLPKYATNGLSKRQLELQQSLMSRNPCPKGLIWLKQEAGWRCEGGAHWLSDNQADHLHKGQDFGMMSMSEDGIGPRETWSNPPDFRRTDLGKYHEQSQNYWAVGRSTAKSTQGHTRQRRDVQRTSAEQRQSAQRILTRQQQETRRIIEMKGPCPAGYKWLKVPGGWRCEPGAHWLTDEQAERLARGEDPGLLGLSPPPGFMPRGRSMVYPGNGRFGAWSPWSRW